MTTGKPDFLYVDEECPLILDTKYKPRYGAETFDVGDVLDDIRQLAGCARDRKVLKRLGIQEAGEQDSAVVTCVIIFPEVRGVERPRHARKLKGVRFIWPILIQEMTFPVRVC